jgi:hypothetical protein
MKKLLFALLALGASQVIAVASIPCPSKNAGWNPYTKTCTQIPPSQACPAGQNWNLSANRFNNVNHVWFCSPSNGGL